LWRGLDPLCRLRAAASPLVKLLIIVALLGLLITPLWLWYPFGPEVPKYHYRAHRLDPEECYDIESAPNPNGSQDSGADAPQPYYADCYKVYRKFPTKESLAIITREIDDRGQDRESAMTEVYFYYRDADDWDVDVGRVFRNDEVRREVLGKYMEDDTVFLHGAYVSEGTIWTSEDSPSKRVPRVYW
jgi:hypothetical protein